MTTNSSGKLNMGGVDAIKKITAIPPADWREQQRHRLNACLIALAHQPRRLYVYQDWGAGGPEQFLADRGIEFFPDQINTPMKGATTMGAGAGRSIGVLGDLESSARFLRVIVDLCRAGGAAVEGERGA